MIHVMVQNPSKPPATRLDRAFYAIPAEKLAARLIGKILVRRIDSPTGPPIVRRARLIETEAYVGEHDLACHASKGRTLRTDIMFGLAGLAYVYLIYGMYDMLNIVCSVEGDAQAVLIRAATPLDGWEADLSGPGKLCRAMQITCKHDNGTDLAGERLYLIADQTPSPRYVRTPRIGVDYAGKWKDARLRFVVRSTAAKARRHVQGSLKPTR